MGVPWPINGKIQEGVRNELKAKNLGLADNQIKIASELFEKATTMNDIGDLQDTNKKQAKAIEIAKRIDLTKLSDNEKQIASIIKSAYA